MANKVIHGHVDGEKRTYHFHIGLQNIQPDIHKYLVQYKFLNSHRQDHIQLRL